MNLSFHDRLYISTTASDAEYLASEYNLGIEIAEYCTAYNMDQHFRETDSIVRSKMHGTSRFVFHGPFNELCPAAIDPLIKSICEKRYLQAIRLSETYGIKKIVLHSGFVPTIYFPEWFEEQSVLFWKSFFSCLSSDVEICLENVMEKTPEMLFRIVDRVNDPRFFLCLDIGHAHCCSEGVSIDQWISNFAPRLSHVHIHNNYGSWDQHNPLNDGTLNMKHVISSLEALKLKPTYTIENMHAEESVSWLIENSFM